MSTQQYDRTNVPQSPLEHVPENIRCLSAREVHRRAEEKRQTGELLLVELQRAIHRDKISRIPTVKLNKPVRRETSYLEELSVLARSADPDATLVDIRAVERRRRA